MVTFILAILIGLGISYFSIQNTHGVTIKLANYPVTDVPLYGIVIGAMLIGLCIGAVMNIFRLISSSITIHGKDIAVKNATNTVKELQQRLHDAELENKLLREKLDEQYIGTPLKTDEEKLQTPLHFPYLTRWWHNLRW